MRVAVIDSVQSVVVDAVPLQFTQLPDINVRKLQKVADVHKSILVQFTHPSASLTMDVYINDETLTTAGANALNQSTKFTTRVELTDFLDIEVPTVHGFSDNVTITLKVPYDATCLFILFYLHQDVFLVPTSAHVTYRAQYSPVTGAPGDEITIATKNTVDNPNGVLNVFFLMLFSY